MRNLVHEAGFLALDELKEGRRSVILFPHSGWSACAFEMGSPPEGVFLRFASNPSSLLALKVDRLILVASDDPDWDLEGRERALNHLLAPGGQVIEVKRTQEDDDADGTE